MNKQELIEKLKEEKEKNHVRCVVANPAAIEVNNTFYQVDKSLETAINYAEQLDEPQKVSWRKAISVLEHHFQCEIPRNLDQVIEGFKNMSSLMNSVEFELDKQGSKLSSKEFVLEALGRYKQKVKVPAFVDKWISKHYYMGKYVCLERFMCQYNSVELPTDLYNYYDSDKEGARDKVISAILGGYEVEEEPKWVVKQKDGFYIDGLAMIEGKTYAKTFESEAEACKWAELCSGLIEKV